MQEYALILQATYVFDISKHMFYEEIRIKQDLPFCPLRILYNSKFILMAISLGTKAVVVTGVHCNSVQV